MWLSDKTKQREYVFIFGIWMHTLLDFVYIYGLYYLLEYSKLIPLLRPCSLRQSYQGVVVLFQSLQFQLFGSQSIGLHNKGEFLILADLKSAIIIFKRGIIVIHGNTFLGVWRLFHCLRQLARRYTPTVHRLARFGLRGIHCFANIPDCCPWYDN